MIASIQHKGLKRLWEHNDATKLPPDHVNKIRNILTMLDAAEDIADMNFPGSGLHPLKGKLAGHWAVAVNGNWRITFKFKDGNAYLVNYLDYH
ncbi:peptidase [Niastella koreensis]|uniref:Plasmid maintenance system killer n=2 Tax=Niastella koreensis TaxID=354356 RepID=G8TJF9_NIAKG|nr:type II toxin-antitoxin system RelE/ParE family toxin [Niastella koreensis]AEV99694.1 plasmid maintenance system killer [Niastella koreensis GR20-10]OQP44278.1 peptidase [Niastella koreensis]